MAKVETTGAETGLSSLPIVALCPDNWEIATAVSKSTGGEWVENLRTRPALGPPSLFKLLRR
jgi:hypothetical protein